MWWNMWILPQTVSFWCGHFWFLIWCVYLMGALEGATRRHIMKTIHDMFTFCLTWQPRRPTIPGQARFCRCPFHGHCCSTWQTCWQTWDPTKGYCVVSITTHSWGSICSQASAPTTHAASCTWSSKYSGHGIPVGETLGMSSNSRVTRGRNVWDNTPEWRKWQCAELCWEPRWYWLQPLSFSRSTIWSGCSKWNKSRSYQDSWKPLSLAQTVSQASATWLPSPKRASLIRGFRLTDFILVWCCKRSSVTCMHAITYVCASTLRLDHEGSNSDRHDNWVNP